MNKPSVDSYTKSLVPHKPLSFYHPVSKQWIKFEEIELIGLLENEDLTREYALLKGASEQFIENLLLGAKTVKASEELFERLMNGKS